MDTEATQIEQGERDTSGDMLLYPKGVLDALNLIFKNRKFPRPRGKQSPQFTFEDVRTLAYYLFFKSPYVEIRTRERLSRRREIPLKRTLFIHHFLYGDAKFNGAKAARMAGYSVRSAKQIAYRIKQS